MADVTTPAAPVLVLHIDDLGASLGANEAMEATHSAGSVLSGSAIVNGAWLPDLVERASRIDMDLGVHLALTSESAGFRWRPLIGSSTSSGLVDDDGYLWPDVDSLRSHADPIAVIDELTAQIELALAVGLEPTHLDHHMGAALAPEIVEMTADVVEAHQIPVLFPADVAGYVAGVDWDDSELGPLIEQRKRLVAAGLAFGDRFMIPLRRLGDPVRVVLEEIVTEADPGFNYVSLHCATDADILAIHPDDGEWRIEECRLLSDPGFVAWIENRGVALTDVRSQL